MARVRVVRTVRVGGRQVPVREGTLLQPRLSRALVQATAVQMRVLAQETRELIIDRLWAAVPQPPGRAVVPRPAVRADRPDLVSAVSREPFDHAPLARRTVLRKARLNRDGRKLIETGELARGIVLEERQSAAGPRWIVRLASRRHASGLTLFELARLHEFGSMTARIPPRPVWGPVGDEIAARFQRLARRIGRGKLDAATLRRVLREIA